MRIGIDARFYGPAATGIGIYSEELIRNLMKIDRQNHYVIFLRAEGYHALKLRAGNFEKILVEVPHYSVSEQLFLNSYFNRAKLDFIHFLNFNKPLTYKKPYLVTIHDLTLLLFPSTKNVIRQKMFSWVLKSTVKNARKIVAISENTKKDLKKYLNVPTNKIKVIYQGIPPGFRQIKNIQTLNQVKQKFKIHKSYLIYTGQQRSHKNLVRLVEAFQILIRKRPNLELVFVGKKNKHYSELENTIKNLTLDDKVIFTGFVSHRELNALYCEAEALVFPSLYEGFGVPPLEAMASGIPTVASNTSCIPEILGDAAYYFDPKSPRNMSDAIAKILGNAKLRKSLIEKGTKQIKKYSWLTTAKKTLEIYESFEKS